MTTRLGVAIGASEVRAVLVENGKVRWESSEAVDGSMDSALDALLRSAPLRRWQRPRVHVAIGPAFAQLRRVHGLPPADTRTLERVVRESAGRFFLRNGVPISTSSVRRDADGSIWAAAFDDPVLHEVEAACARRGLKVSRFLPSVAALRHAPRGAHVRWQDGDAIVEASFDDCRLADARRLPGHDEDAGLERPADALGATLAPMDEIALTVPESAASIRRRLLGSAVFAITGMIAALAAPAIGPSLAAERAASELQSLASRRTAALGSASQLERIRANVAAVNALRSPSALGDLATIATALPAELAILSYRADSAGITIAISGTGASSILADLDSIPGFLAPQMLGAVTRDQSMSNGAPLERATIRLRRATGGSQ